MIKEKDNDGEGKEKGEKEVAATRALTSMTITKTTASNTTLTKSPVPPSVVSVRDRKRRIVLSRIGTCTSSRGSSAAAISHTNVSTDVRRMEAKDMGKEDVTKDETNEEDKATNVCRMYRKEHIRRQQPQLIGEGRFPLIKRLRLMDNGNTDDFEVDGPCHSPSSSIKVLTNKEEEIRGGKISNEVQGENEGNRRVEQKGKERIRKEIGSTNDVITNNIVETNKNNRVVYNNLGCTNAPTLTLEKRRSSILQQTMPHKDTIRRYVPTVVDNQKDSSVVASISETAAFIASTTDTATTRQSGNTSSTSPRINEPIPVLLSPTTSRRQGMTTSPNHHLTPIRDSITGGPYASPSLGNHQHYTTSGRIPTPNSLFGRVMLRTGSATPSSRNTTPRKIFVGGDEIRGIDISSNGGLRGFMDAEAAAAAVLSKEISPMPTIQSRRSIKRTWGEKDDIIRGDISSKSLGVGLAPRVPNSRNLMVLTNPSGFFPFSPSRRVMSPDARSSAKFNNAKTTPSSTPRRVGVGPLTPSLEQNQRCWGSNGVIPADSPGGFALKGMLDRLHNSPGTPLFSKKSTAKTVKAKIDAERLGLGEEINGEVSRATTVSSADIDGWHEAYLRLPHVNPPKAIEYNNASRSVDCEQVPSLFRLTDNRNDEVIVADNSLGATIPTALWEDHDEEKKNTSTRGELGILDWSIKRSMNLESYPVGCTPGLPLPRHGCAIECAPGTTTTPMTIVDWGKVDQLAMDSFLERNLSSPIKESDVDAEVLALARWEASLMYWQHPALHPLPPSMRMTGTVSSSLVPRGSIGIGSGISVGSKSSGTDLSSSLLSRSRTALGLDDTVSRSASLSTSIPILLPSRPIMDIENAELSLKERWCDAKAVTSARIELQRKAKSAGEGCLGGMGQSHIDVDTSGDRGAGRVNNRINGSIPTAGVLWDRRIEEWKECFRYLFLNWIGRFQHVDKKRNGNDIANRKSNKSNNSNSKKDSNAYSKSSCTSPCTPKEEKMARLYFYAISPNLVVLFRWDLRNELNNHELMAKVAVPTILLSSTTEEQRDTLRSMGVKLHIGGSYGQEIHSDTQDIKGKMSMKINNNSDDGVASSRNGVASKGDNNNSVANENINKNNDDKNSNKIDNKSGMDNDDFQIQSELEELRRMTAHGHAAGAEVSFSTSRNTITAASGDSSKTMKSNPRPLYLSGRCDCMAFFEYYLNTSGGTRNLGGSPVTGFGPGSLEKANVQSHIPDVPLLLCRSLGPCRHMTLRHLVVSSRSSGDRATTDTSNDFGKDGQIVASQTSFVELRGPILPCAVRDALSAAASHLALDRARRDFGKSATKEEKKGLVTLLPNNDRDIEELDDSHVLGSHYLVLNLHAHAGEEFSPRDLSKYQTTGSAGSLWFNDTVSVSGKTNFREKNIPRSCGDGEVVNMAIWDVSRPFTVAYSSEQASLIASRKEL